MPATSRWRACVLSLPLLTVVRAVGRHEHVVITTAHPGTMQWITLGMPPLVPKRPLAQTHLARKTTDTLGPTSDPRAGNSGVGFGISARSSVPAVGDRLDGDVDVVDDDPRKLMRFHR